MNLARAPFLAIFTPVFMLALSSCERPASEPVATAEAQGTDQAEAPQAQPNGKIIDILMYTVDPEDSSRQHVFKPRLVTAQVGDTIRFVPTERSHQSSSIGTMLPDGAAGWEGEVNEEVTYVIPKPGIYGYQCVPHYAAGMVGVVIVEGEGKTDNLDFAKMAGHPGLGVPQFVEIFEEAAAKGLLD